MTNPCWKLVLPDVISVNPSPRVWTPTPAASVVRLPVSSHRTSAFPKHQPGRRLATIHTIATSVWGRFRSCSHSLMFKPVDSLATQIAPTAASIFLAKQPWLLHPNTSRFVTSPRPGYANRPTRATDGKRTCTSQDSQPCRLFHGHFSLQTTRITT